MSEVQTKIEENETKLRGWSLRFSVVVARLIGIRFRNVYEFGVADVFELFFWLRRGFRHFWCLLFGSRWTKKLGHDSPNEPRQKEDNDRPDENPKKHAISPCSTDYSIRWEPCSDVGSVPTSLRNPFRC